MLRFQESTNKKKLIIVRTMDLKFVSRHCDMFAFISQSTLHILLVLPLRENDLSNQKILQ